MTEEEFFRKNYPESCYGDKPLSPHWDFFQVGVEFGERQSEEKIEELEQENADLKCECRRCVYTDSPCVLSDYGKDRNGICDHFKDVFDEVAKLKSEKGCESCTKFDEVQVTKAKEIIKELLDTQSRLDPYRDIFRDRILKAEQFLKEVEK